jgi:hypothetical protein
MFLSQLVLRCEHLGFRIRKLRRSLVNRGEEGERLLSPDNLCNTWISSKLNFLGVTVHKIERTEFVCNVHSLADDLNFKRPVALDRSQYSDGLRAGLPGFDSLQWKIFLCSTASKPALGPDPVSYTMGTGDGFVGGKAAGAWSWLLATI